MNEPIREARRLKLEDGILVPPVSSCETLFNCTPPCLNFLIYKMEMWIKAPLQYILVRIK